MARKLMPRKQLSAPPTFGSALGREQLVILLESARDQAVAAAAQVGITDEVINPYVARANALVDELRASTQPVAARLERETAELVADLQHIATTGEAPTSSSSNGMPWGWIIGGALGLGVLWWWGSKQRSAQIDAVIEQAMADGDLEDCGCNG